MYSIHSFILLFKPDLTGHSYYLYFIDMTASDLLQTL